MTTSCEQLDAYLDGVLPAAERVAFETHLASCDRCRPAVESWQRTGEKLEAWAAPFAGAPSAQQLRAFRARLDEAPRSRAWGVWVGAGVLVAATLVAIVSWRSASKPRTEWDVQLVAEGTSRPIAPGAALGSETEAQHVRIGPDEVELAVAAKVEVVEKKVNRTRLKLAHGSMTASVEPGRKGRDFIIDSPPFRVTVVGTVFQLQRASADLRVSTKVGAVLVERLDAGGVVVESRAVKAGETVALPVEPVPSPSQVVEPSTDEAVEAAVDAGSDAETSPAPRVAARGPSARELQAWRRRAARGECDAVLEETQRALKRAPIHAGTWHVYADCARKLGMSSAAVDGYRKVMAYADGAEAAEAMLLAVSLLQDQLKDPKRVIEVTQSIRSSPPEIAASLHVRRARAFQSLKRLVEARREVDLVLENFKSTPAAFDAVRLREELRN